MLPLVHVVAAARPNFMKVAPLLRILRAAEWCRTALVHTGQHYGAAMSDAFFRDLDLPEPAHHLGVGSGSHGEQTGGVMIAYERVCRQERPDALIVVGDVNSTLACALVGAKLGIPVAHLEAGLRSFDRTMPEEINRIVTDRVADLLWTPSEEADENLRAEGVPAERIERVGNIMIDAFEMLRARINASGAREGLGLGRSYGVVTLHRPANVDDAASLARLVESLVGQSETLPLVFPVHPRTRRRLEDFGLWERLAAAPQLTLADPMGYVDFMNVVTGARLVITDSGGVQEETSYLGIPCLTLRSNTERPMTLTLGTNRLVSVETLSAAVAETLAALPEAARALPLWDGRTADRVAASLCRFLASGGLGAGSSLERR